MKYSHELLAEAVAASVSIAGVLRYLGLRQSGGTHAHLSRRIKRLGIDTTHFTGQAHNRGRQARHRLATQDILIVRPATRPRAKPHMLRRALIESGRPYECASCGLTDSWNGKKLTLHVDHVDGNYLDCREGNLRFLCPNCHSQTPTWAGANKRRSL